MLHTVGKEPQIRCDLLFGIRIIVELSLAEHSICEHSCGAVKQIRSLGIRHDALREAAGAFNRTKPHAGSIFDVP